MRPSKYKYPLTKNSLLKRFAFCQSDKFVDQQNMSSSLDHLSMQQCLQSLQTQYPGIASIRLPHSQNFLEKLRRLANNVNYSVPPLYYSQELNQFIQELKDLYQAHLADCFMRPQERADHEDALQAEERTTSDEQSASPPASTITNQPIRFSVACIKQFVSSYNSEQNMRFISRGLMEKNKILLNAHREDSLLPQLSVQLRRQQTCEGKTSDDRVTPGFKKYQSKKQNYARKEINQGPPVLIIGDKIPTEVKEMRDQLKKLSTNNFTMSAEQSQKDLTAQNRQLLNISFFMNIVSDGETKDNIFHEELMPLVVQSNKNAEFFISQLLMKSESNLKQNEFYSSFCAEFLSIPRSQFQWRWEGEQKNKKLNPLHRILTEKLERSFKQTLKTAHRNKLKSTCGMICRLIEKRKLSKQIYYQINKKVINRIIEEIEGGHSIEIIENCFEASIQMVEGLKQYSDYIWEKKQFSSAIDLSYFKHPHPLSLSDALFRLCESAKLPTERISCLLTNMIERKNKNKIDNKITTESTQSTQSQEVENEKLKELFFKALAADDRKQMLAIAENLNENRSFVFELVLSCVYNGSKDQVKGWLNAVVETIPGTNEQFLSAWRNVWRHLMWQQCEFPFMIHAIGVLGVHYMGDKYEQCLIELRADDQDLEEARYFLGKVHKQLSSRQEITDF